MQRCLPLKGLLNTRELGGFPVSPASIGNYPGGQKQVKWGLVYRSGGPENITAADKAALEDRKIKTIVDFRAKEERTAIFELSSLNKNICLSIDAGNLMSRFTEAGEWLYNQNAQEAEAEMLKLYSLLPQEAIPQYRELFLLFSDPDNAPLLFHCSAGKDRTGLASALFLYALGADRETIMEDYLASTEYLRPYWETFIETRPYMVSYMTVKKEYLLSAFACIENYGGMEKYLVNELGADIKLLQSLYTEPAIDEMNRDILSL